MPAIDYTGARGSNTGDVFHELWALRQALSLLAPNTALQAITVEGVRPADFQAAAEHAWEGVDVALYYGEPAAVVPERAEFCQLKYSAANPSRAWTAARLSAGHNRNPASSPIRRLADAYRGWINHGRDSETLAVKLVTNQPIAATLVRAIKLAREGDPSTWATAQGPRTKDVNRLITASGLAPSQFQQFARRLDLAGESGSRFAIEDRVLRAIADWADTDLVETEIKLRAFMRARMLPEATRELITRETMLLQFGVSSPESLFPCPSRIAVERAPVPRSVVDDVLDRMRAGSRRLCLHGSGGVGKTTCLQEVALGLPEGSVLGLLDCYGGGSYLDSNALRHLPRDAFLQLTNSIATELRLPLLLAQSDNANPARQFHRRLGLAAAALAAARPDALLVVVADAADNSIAAAEKHIPPQASFVHDLARLGDLPANVRVLISARTSSLGSLNLPIGFEMFSVQAFTRPETAQNVARLSGSRTTLPS